LLNYAFAFRASGDEFGGRDAIELLGDNGDSGLLRVSSKRRSLRI
jgi:hypothetical protein